MDRYRGSQIIIFSDCSRDIKRLVAFMSREGWVPTVMDDWESLWTRLHGCMPAMLILHLKKMGENWGRNAVRLRTLFTGPFLLWADKRLDLTLRRTLELLVDESMDFSVDPETVGLRIRFWLSTPAPSADASACERFGEWTIQPARREIYFREHCLPTTVVQFELLSFFLKNAGKVVSRDELYCALFQREYNGLDRMIDIQISRLRRLLQETPKQPNYLKTIHGRGYLFCVSPAFPNL